MNCFESQNFNPFLPLSSLVTYAWNYIPGPELGVWIGGSFKKKVQLVRQEGIQWLRGHYFALFWQKPTCTLTFLTLNVDKNSDFLYHLSTTSSYPRIHWMSPSHNCNVGLKSILRIVYFNARWVVFWVFFSIKFVFSYFRSTTKYRFFC